MRAFFAFLCLRTLDSFTNHLDKEHQILKQLPLTLKCLFSVTNSLPVIHVPFVLTFHKPLIAPFQSHRWAPTKCKCLVLILWDFQQIWHSWWVLPPRNTFFTWLPKPHPLLIPPSHWSLHLSVHCQSLFFPIMSSGPNVSDLRLVLFSLILSAANLIQFHSFTFVHCQLFPSLYFL